MNNRGMSLLQVHIEPEKKKALRIISAEMDKTITDIIRELVDEFLEGNNGIQKH